MKILHLSTLDGRSGAAIGTYWLHKALQAAGVDSTMLVAYKQGTDPSVLGHRNAVEKWGYLLRAKLLPGLLLRRYPRRVGSISPAMPPSWVHNRVRAINPDVINLHWVCNGFVNPGNLPRFEKPIVWTLRDMWPFTGGCHYAQSCTRYEQACGTCPLLASDDPNDITHQLWQRKATAWSDVNLTAVGISHWIADCAQRSSLFRDRRVEVIHNAVDVSKFKPVDKQRARQTLNLPPDKRFILFGAAGHPTQDRRKGFQELLAAINKLQSDGLSHTSALVIFGSTEPGHPPNYGFETHYLGYLKDEVALARAYSACDVMVVPSLEEAFGKVAIEALACGTPVVSFNATGLKDIVQHQQCGYQAQPFDPDDLARGIAWVLEDAARWQHLSLRARERVLEAFTLEQQAQKYMQLYAELTL